MDDGETEPTVYILCVPVPSSMTSGGIRGWLGHVTGLDKVMSKENSTGLSRIDFRSFSPQPITLLIQISWLLKNVGTLFLNRVNVRRESKWAEIGVGRAWRS
jgi:hypothetical protein